jgi:hypothetical protein
MSDGTFTQDEIDRLISGIDEKYEKERELRRKELKRNALTVREIVGAIRDARMGEYRINFTLSDKEAEELIIRYAKMCTTADIKL